MAGEIVTVGEDVKQWKKGDRVCSNFSTAYLYGDPDEESYASSLGGQSPGVLTQYRQFPASVRRVHSDSLARPVCLLICVIYRFRLWSSSRIIFPMPRPLLCRELQSP